MTRRSLRHLALVVAGLALGLASAGAFAQSKGGGALARYVAPDFCGAIVIHPQRIAQSPVAAALKEGGSASAGAAPALAMLQAQAGLASSGIDAQKLASAIQGKPIRRVVVLLDALLAPKPMAAPGVILQFEGPVDGKAILAALSADWKPADAGGTPIQTLKNPAEGLPPIAVCVCDEQTIIGGLQPTVEKMLAKDQGQQPLLDQLRHTSLENDIVVEFLAAPLLAKLAKSPEALAALGDPTMALMAQEVKSLSTTINLSGATLFHAELTTAKDETAAQVKMMADMGVAAGKMKLEEFKAKPPAIAPADIAPLVSKLGDEVLGGLTLKNEGPKLVIDLPMPASLVETLKAISKKTAALAQGK